MASDLEITRKCAEAMGCVDLVDADVKRGCYEAGMEHAEGRKLYNPLHNDAQALELVKRFRLWVIPYVTAKFWRCEPDDYEEGASHPDLNRAICECVARMGEPHA